MTEARPDPTARSWYVEAQIPEAHVDAVMRCCMAGEPELRIRGPHANVLLCALPKSASLHVTQLLSHSLGLVNVPVGFAMRGGRAYYPRLVLAKYGGAPTISHCHNQPDAYTRQIVERMGFRPVVLWRNLLDALVSRRDMTLDARGASGLLSKGAYERLRGASDEEQLDATIDLYAPTYLSFCAAWTEAKDDPLLRPVFATFDEMKRDEVALVGRIAGELGLPFDRARAEDVSARIRSAGGVHLSARGKGASGRGREQITPAQVERLRRMALRFGCTDEAFLGFPLDPARRGAESAHAA